MKFRVLQGSHIGHDGHFYDEREIVEAPTDLCHSMNPRDHRGMEIGDCRKFERVHDDTPVTAKGPPKAKIRTASEVAAQAQAQMQAPPPPPPPVQRSRDYTDIEALGLMTARELDRLAAEEEIDLTGIVRKEEKLERIKGALAARNPKGDA